MDIHLRDDIRFINKFLYSVQKHRIALQNWIDAKTRDGIEVSKRVLKLYEDLETQENTAKKIARDVVSFTDIWHEFFEQINGIGECLATSLLAEIGDIAKFPTVSSLWAYSGLTSEYVKATCDKGHKLIMSSDKHKTCPVFNNQEKEPCGGIVTIIERVKGKAPKRQAGHHYMFNGNLKMIAWKIGEQLIKQGDEYYRKIYYTEKEKQAREHPELTKLHVHNRAKRKMVKHLFCHLWEAWRTIEHHDVRMPYVIEKLGHQGYIKWAELKQQLAEVKAKIKNIDAA